MEINWLQWADPSGAVVYFGVMGAILLGSALKLFAGSRWDDWLSEPLGRGSIRDEWALRRRRPEQGAG